MQLSKLYILTLGLGLGLGSAVSCATAPPQELVDARAQYRAAAAGPAQSQAPAALDTAKSALAQAEQAFADEPDAAETRDLAYIAQRKAQLADVKASTEIANQKKISSQKELTTANKEKLAETKEQLKDSRQETQDSRVDLATSEQKNANSQERLADSNTQLADSKDQLAAEKLARQAIEEQNKELVASLAKFATVKEDDRGTVISLSGGVLFASGKSALLPSALSALDSVAGALNKKNEQSITVEGHTDSVGAVSFNQQLSRDRAEAVRNYLVSRGVASSRIGASGLGSSRPVADNGTPDGRANNRRVEIVILHKAT